MVGDHHECYWTLCLKKSERVIRRPVSLHGFVFIFNFSLEVRNFNWVQIPGSLSKDFVRRDSPYTVDAIAQIPVKKYFSYGDMREAVEGALGPLPLLDGARQGLIGHAMVEACEAFIAKCIHDYVSIDLELQLLLESDHIFYSLDEFKRYSMVATDSSRVQFLNKYEDASGNVTESCCCCCICLEDVPDDGGGEATWLPGSHIFHSSCIDEWLRAANHCPLCRHELDSLDSPVHLVH